MAVTVVAVLGGAGILPSGPGSTASAGALTPASSEQAPTAEPAPTAAPRSDPVPAQTPEPDRENPGEAPQPAPTAKQSAGGADAWLPALPSFTLPTPSTALPADSGEGRRVVFSESRQRVWLVQPERSGADRVLRTYLVSGSIYDNLDPGTYEVYSRSEQAYGIDDSGTMKYFVRFTRGENAAIGFHDIPIDDGEPVQTKAQLGTPLSHGCIRQVRADAKALWAFAPLGTTVVVTA